MTEENSEKKLVELDLFKKATSQDVVTLSGDAMANLLLALKEQQVINTLLMTCIMKAAIGNLSSADIDRLSERQANFEKHEEQLLQSLGGGEAQHG